MEMRSELYHEEPVGHQIDARLNSGYGELALHQTGSGPTGLLLSGALLNAVSSYTAIDPDKAYYYLSTVSNLLTGPWFIMMNNARIISIVVIARLITLLIDIIKPGSQLIKNLIVITFGLSQLQSYLKQTTTDETAHYFMTRVLPLCCILQCTLSLLNRSQPKDNGTRILYSTIVASIAPILQNEYFIYYGLNPRNVYLRSILMILSMKLISYPEIGPRLSGLAYLLHPASSIFGPWHPNLGMSVMLKCESRLGHAKLFYSQLKQSALSFGKAMIVLMIWIHGTDALHHFSSSVESYHVHEGLRVYSIAQEFRSSHFFTMLLASSLLRLWTDPSENNGEICQILPVEFPRSLTQVVISWNIPMHKWLKDYIFKPMKTGTSSVAVAIIITYISSSLLHGFKFHIWSVLLTLGFLTWVEHRLRMTISRKLDACVEAKRCQYSLPMMRCLRGHKLTPKNSWLVRVLNLSFSILASLHLAYLGYIFQGNTDEANFMDVITHWADLYYYSHLIGLVCLLVTAKTVSQQRQRCPR